MPIQATEYSELNRAIRKWAGKMVKLIVDDMHQKGVRHRSYSPSREAIFLLVKSALKTKFGAPERVSITFPKHLVFVKYGVGKYRAKGSGKESPKDIVDNIIDENFNELADTVASNYADVAVNNLFIDKNRVRK